jgi:hypothetical protein
MIGSSLRRVAFLEGGTGAAVLLHFARRSRTAAGAAPGALLLLLA